jgi:hypothetical protein
VLAGVEGGILWPEGFPSNFGRWVNENVHDMKAEKGVQLAEPLTAQRPWNKDQSGEIWYDL